MLYYVTSKGKEFTWHVGSNKPEVSDCVQVQADGHEFAFILKVFSNLPHCYPEVTPVQTWNGDLAKFIYDNMPLTWREF